MNAAISASAVDIQEPVYVFGSQIEAPHISGSGEIAVRFHGAQNDCWQGYAGNSYAIPYLDRGGHALHARTLTRHIADFIQFARQHPELRFRIARFACEPGLHSDQDIAPLFRAAPTNCKLPALWRRELGLSRTARVLVYDPLIRLKNAEWREYLQQYLTINMPLWEATQCELLSVGSKRRVSAVAQAASILNVKHREINANPAYYGKEYEVASEILAVWHATHMMSITDANQTALPSHFRLVHFAHRNGLSVDDMTLR